MMNLEGSEEDFASLLVHHRIITDEQRTAAFNLRKRRNATGIDSFRDELVRSQVVPARKILDDIRGASRVAAICTRCSADHTIHYYWSSSRYFCKACQGLLRVTDPGQSTTWRPGDAVLPDPAGNPDSTMTMLPSGGMTMLGLGTTTPEPPRPAPPPPQLPVDSTMEMMPAGGETMLGMSRPLAPTNGTTHETTKPVVDDAVVQRAVAGDAAALEAIYHAYKNIVWRIARASLGDHHEAEEALQEIFPRLFRSLNRYDKKAGDLKSYITAIARNVCRDRHKARARRLGQAAEQRIPEAIEQAAESISSELMALVQRAIGDGLDKRSREIIECKVSGLRNKEIAAKLGLDEGTVSSYLTRSIRAIREYLKKKSSI